MAGTNDALFKKTQIFYADLYIIKRENIIMHTCIYNFVSILLVMMADTSYYYTVLIKINN